MFSCKSIPGEESEETPVSLPQPKKMSNNSGFSFSNWKAAWQDTDQSSTTPILRISVCEPEESGNILIKHVTYLVSTDPLGYVVRRRFNDFVWLRDTLTNKYLGLLIPSLPLRTVVEKVQSKIRDNSSSVSESEFIRIRMTLLSLFLNLVVANPFLRSDPSVQAFLSIQDPKEWERSQKATKDIYEDTSHGCVRWREIIESCVVPSDSERKIQDFMLQLERLQKVLEEVQNAARQLADRARVWEEETALLASSFRDWHNVENEFSNSSKVEFENKYSSEMNDTMSSFKELTEGWRQGLSLQSVNMETILYCYARYNSASVQAFQNVLKFRSSEIEKLEKMESRGKKETEIEAQRKKTNFLTKALCFHEIDRFNAERAAAVQYLQFHLIQSQNIFAQKLIDNWSPLKCTQKLVNPTSYANILTAAQEFGGILTTAQTSVISSSTVLRFSTQSTRISSSDLYASSRLKSNSVSGSNSVIDRNSIIGQRRSVSTLKNTNIDS